ncbi:MAG TPA: chromosome segregation protein SMC [bacterium]|nr:chromosome segregation protein SMC [bacterium]
MEDKRLLKTLRLRNLLSYGPENEEIELMPLNVLIGPNASGKSNIISAIDLLRYTAWDINDPIRAGGGIKEWIWKGEENVHSAEIETSVNIKIEKTPLLYRLSFSAFLEHLHIDEEILEKEKIKNEIKDIFYRNQGGKAELTIKRYVGSFKPLNVEYETQSLHTFKDFNRGQSILSQRKDPLLYPEITNLGYMFGGIKIYRNWYVGINSNPRLPQKTDLPTDFLSENLNNFALIVNDLKDRRETKELIVDKLKQFYIEFDSIRTIIQGGTVQLFIYEKGLKKEIPITRLSDGTLRYLCLLMILCHPEPPPLICIEEPEIGLHPDIMPALAELLLEASQRTQLIVTTHSDTLVSALTEKPESIIICEHDISGSHLHRLEKDKLKVWIEKYTLGELWQMGEIGGTRW